MVSFSHKADAVRNFEAAEVVHFLGLLRDRLGTNEFVPVEEKAWEWLEDNFLKTFWWRYQTGHGYGGKGLLSPKSATLLAEYLFDFPLPGKENPGLTRDLARWCDDQFRNWHRGADVWPTPCVLRSEGSGPQSSRAATVANVYRTLYATTGDSPYLAKARALIGSLYMMRDPINGGIEAQWHAIVDARRREGPDFSIDFGLTACFLGRHADYENAGTPVAHRSIFDVRTA